MKKKKEIKKDTNYKTPPEEFAKRPTFLRWFTEWGEEFCKERQKKEDKIKSECNGKSAADFCNKEEHPCKKACKEYESYVKKKYEEFKGQTNRFVQKARDKNPDKEYSGYEYKPNIQSKQGNDYLKDKCDNNKCSCMKGNARSDKPEDEPFGKYFNKTLAMCDCTSGVYKPSVLPVLPQQTETCENLKKYIQENEKERNKYQGCHKKFYKGWDCTKDIHRTHKGACMPPRRQKLCIYKLTRDNDTKDLKELKMSFIKSAALETYLAWEIYKGNNIDAITELQNGQIPEGFKRIMFYTFGDFRDMCLGTDISSKANKSTGVGKVESSINKLFPNVKNSKSQDRKTWWNSIEKEVWEGMLCGLSHAGGNDAIKSNQDYQYSEVKIFKQSDGSGITLSQFAERPQFLRWMIEWSEHFCKEQKEEYGKLVAGCTGCDVSTDGNCTQKGNCKNCSSQCKEYQKFITQWKVQWEKQRNKYTELYEKTNNDSNHLTDAIERSVIDYFKTLSSNGTTYSTAGKYINEKGYIQDCKEQKNFSNDDGDNKYAFSNYPNDYEKQCTCKTEESTPPPVQPPQPKPAGGPGGVGRSLPPAGPDDVLSSSEDDEDEDDDEDDEDDEEEASEEEGGASEAETEEDEEHVDGAETPKDTTDQDLPSPPEPTTEKSVDACGIVKMVFEDGSTLKEACKTKYDGKYYGWRCVNTTGSAEGEAASSNPRVRRSAPGGEKSGDKGAICIPPRRRKLYLHKIEGVDTTESVIEWFVKSAAVETFFLWHKYKEEKKPPATQNGALPLPLAPDVSQEDDPQKKLEKGDIPEEFKRQMFYTLGDYRDICIGGDRDIVGDTIVSNTDSTEKSSGKATKISDVIKEFLSKQNSGDNPSPRSVKTGSNSGNDPASLWNKHAESIWNGMICALTYKDGGEGKSPQVDDKVKKALLDGEGKKPKNNGQQDYTYEKVELKDNDENGGPRTTGASIKTEPTKLTDFVKRPPYFRYLEEWGQHFCKERKKRLAQIKVECKVDENSGSSRRGKNGNKKCSGYGENCDDNLSQKYNILPSFNCRSCGIECRKYKNWIKGKRKEFDKQKEAYGEQKKKCQTQRKGAEGDDHDKEFCATLNTYSKAGDFLERLKNGPCSKTYNENDNGKDNQEDEINFNDPEQTFKHTKYCDPCSQFKIDCKNGKCDNDKGGDCNGKNSIDANDIETMGNFTHDVDMLVSDNSGNGSQNDLKDCIKAGIFKGIRKDVWTCGNVCGYNVCKPINVNDLKVNGTQNQNQIIIITAFVKLWVQNFLEDYKKIKHKISHCTNTVEGSKCINGCQNKCTCVKAWITKKSAEWTNIKNRFNEQYKNNDQTYPVRSILEELIPQIGAANDKAEHETLEEFEKSVGCNCHGRSKKENDKNNDVIDCMLNKLQRKITACQKLPIGSPEEKCGEDPTPLEDDDEPMEEENSVTQPKICPKVEEKKKEEDESECKASQSPAEPEQAAEEPARPATESEQKPEEELPPPPAPAPAAPPSTPLAPADEPFNRDILEKTIPFGIALALGSIAFLFLKKKPKSPVDLLRVLDVHKGDYGMPTPKSSNRYIPYVSDTYKGKTYIYMEGDSDEDKYAFMSDTTDITSSESEYEEMDINDIYVPGSPKYKTLIEVVLEPSKGNGNTLGDDMVPTTNTFTDEEWNELKHDFISQYIQSRLPMDVPQYDVLKELPMNIGGNVFGDKMDEKPFITSIHDRDLYTGKEISYNIHMSTNSMDDPKHVSNNVYSGIDLINDSLNSGNQPIDIYDEVLKRKENELFGTNYKKNTSNNSVAKHTNTDPLHNQINLLHKWLDRHRNICENWGKKEDILNKLKEEWEQDNNSGDIRSDNHVMNTNVSIEIDIDENKGKKEFSNMDTILDDMEDDIYYDVNDENPSVNDIPMDHNKVDVPKKVHVEMKILNNTFNGSLEPEFPISDVWNI
ncbi:hypothetical protein PFFVO_06113 [Plasmodium falciparum Vietnam Oak-Knoll (FVO)]|uniref:Erythrocyte membrane protein 1, PfEMP1 n=1 Tax=Plasmodium falciparum Vietnam Oak-Knoll (FVO) TaxID=1036723 RepID=A0A024UXJ7_PLAFA|nr:hypothetical protein PFFVO_06113 [Plasmodium falciparum Vietnam Oak-Knoll (FVO)]